MCFPRWAPVLRDSRSRCVWLQTEHWCADLRVPADGPDFSAVRSIAQCSHSQLVWLATQTSFVAQTFHEEPRCTWHHSADLVPLPFADCARLRFEEPDLLEERGVDIPFFERWKRDPAGDGPQAILQANDSEGSGQHLMFISGQYVMHVQPRVQPLPRAAPSPLCPSGWKRWTEAELRLLLSYRARLCRQREQGHVIELSLYPWETGSVLFDEVIYDGSTNAAKVLGGGTWLPRRWSRLL